MADESFVGYPFGKTAHFVAGFGVGGFAPKVVCENGGTESYHGIAFDKGAARIAVALGGKGKLAAKPLHEVLFGIAEVHYVFGLRFESGLGLGDADAVELVESAFEVGGLLFAKILPQRHRSGDVVGHTYKEYSSHGSAFFAREQLRKGAGCAADGCGDLELHLAAECAAFGRHVLAVVAFVPADTEHVADVGIAAGP